MVIDAAGRHVAQSELVGKALARTDVMGTPLAREVFAFVDAVWLNDDRIREVSDARPNDGRS
jgi:hypothetical protein